MARKLDFLPQDEVQTEGPDPTAILTKKQAADFGVDAQIVGGVERDPTAIVSKAAAQRPRGQNGGQVPQQQGNYWEVDWGVAAQVLYTQGQALKGMDNDAAKVSAGVILAIADALVVGIRSAAAKR